MTIQELREKLSALHGEAKSIVDTASQEGRDLTADEQSTVDAHMDEVEKLQADIKRRERLEQQGEALEASNRRMPPRQPSEEPHVGPATDQRENDPQAGFTDFGEYARAVRTASIPGGARDQRLDIAAAAAGTYANEGTGADGGFLVPPTFSAEVRRLALEEDSFLAMTDQNQIVGNSMRFPADETTPWGTNGVRARWESEGTAAQQDKPVLKYKELRAHKLISLVPTSEELMEDANALESYLTRLMGRSIRWKLNDALINGSGAGQPLGIANSGAKVQVSRAAANEISAADVLKMYSRQLPAGQSTAVWIANSDILPQLGTMTIGDQPIFMPPNQGITNAPGGILLGRPVMFSETAESLGTAGDLRLVNWQDYVTIEKAGGIQNAMSMHLFFDADQMAFRATFRVDGQPWLDNPVQKNKGSNTLSSIVELQ